MPQLWQLGRTAKVPDAIGEIEFFANADDTQLLAEVYCSKEIADGADNLPADLRSALSRNLPAWYFLKPAAAKPKLGAIRNGSLSAAPTTFLCGWCASYRVSAGSFFQVNRHLVDELLHVVAGDGSATTSGTALDLYAGVGLFSSVLNREFERVIAVESSPTSHSDLLYNSPANVKAVHATTEQYLEHAAGKLRPALVVVDPPRSGLGEKVIRGLASLKAPRLVYVSCDPATLSRDLSRLLQSGYRVQQAHLVDLFPQTYHLESVLHLVR